MYSDEVMFAALRKAVRLVSGHHKNGVRHDNRPSNLELRVAAHPRGLSIPEALAWANEIIERYGGLRVAA